MTDFKSIITRYPSTCFFFCSKKIQHLSHSLFKPRQESDWSLTKSWRAALLFFNAKSSWRFELYSQSWSIHSSEFLHSKHLISKQLLQWSCPAASSRGLQLHCCCSKIESKATAGTFKIEACTLCKFRSSHLASEMFSLTTINPIEAEK